MNHQPKTSILDFSDDLLIYLHSFTGAYLSLSKEANRITAFKNLEWLNLTITCKAWKDLRYKTMYLFLNHKTSEKYFKDIIYRRYILSLIENPRKQLALEASNNLLNNKDPSIFQFHYLGFYCHKTAPLSSIISVSRLMLWNCKDNTLSQFQNIVELLFIVAPLKSDI